MSRSVSVTQAGVNFGKADVLPAAGVLRAVVYRHVSYDTLRHWWSQSDLDHWLSIGEREILAELYDGGRRESWLFGRLLAKQLIRDEIALLHGRVSEFQPALIEIHSRDGLGRRVHPRIVVDGRLLEYSLSIAHSANSVLVALSLVPGRRVGVDVTPLEVQSESFSRLWLTPGEQAWAMQAIENEKYLMSKLWAVKEAFYKASNTARPFVPGAIEVRPDANDEWSVWLSSRHRTQCGVCVFETDGEVIAIVTMEEGHKQFYD